MTVLLLAAVLTLSAALTYTLFTLAYARTLVSPPRMTDGKALLRLGRMSPRDLNLPYEDLTLPGHGAETPAWWIPLPGSKQTAILIHAFGDAKVGALAWAPLFRDLGFNLLLLDLRAHGDSKTPTHTAARLEAQDLAALLRDLPHRFPAATESIVLFGASFGAAVISAYAAQNPEPNVKAIILDSPVASFESGAIAHANLFALPGPFVARSAIRLAQRWMATHLPDFATAHTLPHTKLPTLLILPENDAYLSPTDRTTFQTLTTTLPLTHLWQPPTTHLLAINTDPTTYRRQLQTFLEKYQTKPKLFS